MYVATINVFTKYVLFNYLFFWYIFMVVLGGRGGSNQAKGIPLYKHFAELAGNSGPMVLPVPCFNVVSSNGWNVNEAAANLAHPNPGPRGQPKVQA